MVSRILAAFMRLLSSAAVRRQSGALTLFARRLSDAARDDVPFLGRRLGKLESRRAAQFGEDAGPDERDDDRCYSAGDCCGHRTQEGRGEPASSLAKLVGSRDCER